MRPLRVIGIDPGIKVTGVALPDGRTLEVAVASREGYARHRFISQRIAELAVDYRVEAAVLEGIGGGGHRIATIVAAELGGAIRSELVRLGVFFYESPAPNVLKKWATGNGRAEKPAMIDAAIRRGAREPLTDNEADAYLLRAMALEDALKVTV